MKQFFQRQNSSNSQLDEISTQVENLKISYEFYKKLVLDSACNYFFQETDLIFATCSGDTRKWSKQTGQADLFTRTTDKYCVSKLFD